MVLTYLIKAVMMIQILIGFVWMARNLLALPPFGDSAEYLNLSKDFQLDEYRPILYPLILRCICEVSERLPIPYQLIVYVMQTLVSFCSILFTVRALDHVMHLHKGTDKKLLGDQVFLTLYLMTIPMITFMNFSVLTDSLATSMLLLFLTDLMLLLWYEKIPKRVYVLLAVSLLTQSLLRADRLYSSLVLAVIVFLFRILRCRKNTAKRHAKTGCRQLLLAMFAVCVLIPLCVKGVNHATQTPGIHGRIETNADFILLDRIVWPNMRANYPDFSDEIKGIIKKKEAKTFDKHNNNVMYQMAPLVEERAGKENAGRIYREMAAVVWQNQSGKVMADIGEDILAMVFTPVSSLLNAYKLCSKGDGWNVTCMSSETPLLTRTYSFYYQYTFLLLLLLGILLSLPFRKNGVQRQLGTFLKNLMPFIGMGLLLTLWFCIGDGAPPNDRYALSIYFTWSVFTVGLLGRWQQETKHYY